MLLEADGLVKEFPLRGFERRGGMVRAVDGVDLRIDRGETLALVGESGSGKTTVGRCLLRLVEPTAGRVWFEGEDFLALRGEALRRRRRDLQMVFQDSGSALDPRMRIGASIAEPLAAHGVGDAKAQRRRAEELIALVGLPEDSAGRFPHEFSGGQRQRIGIARALATEPSLVVADEPTSALDVTVRAQILALLRDLKARFGMAVLLISHDLSVVAALAQHVAVMYLGRVVERAATVRVLAAPQHPYTVSLLSAVPRLDPAARRRRIVLGGDAANPAAPPPGCPFHPRCPIARPHCASDVPPLREIAPGHFAACHYPGELML